MGRELGDREFPTTPSGYRALLSWLRGHGQLERVGIEGTRMYGAALSRHLHAAGVEVVEVDRLDRKARRAQRESDPLDAYSAARAALAGRATGAPKARDGRVEAIRVLRVARGSAVASPEHATKTAMRRLARRHQLLSEEITDADAEFHTLVSVAAPRLIALPGVGAEVAGQLLTTVGVNPDRLHFEAAFAHQCGVAPIPASSGRTRGACAPTLRRGRSRWRWRSSVGSLRAGSWPSAGDRTPA